MFDSLLAQESGRSRLLAPKESVCYARCVLPAHDAHTRPQLFSILSVLASLPRILR